MQAVGGWRRGDGGDVDDDDHARPKSEKLASLLCLRASAVNQGVTAAGKAKQDVATAETQERAKNDQELQKAQSDQDKKLTDEQTKAKKEVEKEKKKAETDTDGEVRIAIVGKYTQLEDAYKSIAEALTHGGMANRVRVRSDWIAAEDIEAEGGSHLLDGYHAILVPGGFGERGTEGMVRAARYAREKKVPYFGICLGMQMAVIEAARNLAGIDDAGSEEFDHEAGQNRFTPIVYHLKEWVQGNYKVQRSLHDDKGGTMRLGAYTAILDPSSRISAIYDGATEIEDRHRHRYEVDSSYIAQLEKAGLSFSGMSPDGKLPEVIEYRDHPWFIGVQAHPELKSKPFDPAPLFADFIRAAKDGARLV